MAPNSATGDGLNRRALLISVGFVREPDPASGPTSWPRLPFAAGACDALAAALKPFGYEPRLLADPAASKVTEEIEFAITSTPKDGVLIVSFIGHGDFTSTDELST